MEYVSCVAGRHRKAHEEVHVVGERLICALADTPEQVIYAGEANHQSRSPTWTKSQNTREVLPVR